MPEAAVRRTSTVQNARFDNQNYYIVLVKSSAILLLVVVAEALVAALGLSIYGWTIEGLQATTRFSGRLSLLIFSFIFLLYPGKQNTLHGILSPKPFLAFALAHGIHLVELLSYVYLAGIVLVPYRVAGGFMAYSMIFLMPWFQQRAETGSLGKKRFMMISMIYLFYVWFIFFMTYVARLNGSFQHAGGTFTEHAILMGWVCAMLILKLTSVFMKKNGQTENLAA